jgi:bifunctional UDP-N-acetylglucosamine pyrophosphorylase/glucosamine-1-phosphate N-acetyltransferase
MQCVILAAGKGTRMLPLTEYTPKPLIKVLGRPVLDYIVEALPPEITELILVTNYLEEQIKEHCGAEFYGRKVTYVTQTNPAGGTGAALLCAKGLVVGKFLMLNGDDIHGTAALQEAINQPNALIGVHSETPEKFGVLEVNPDGTLKAIIEKPENPTSNLVHTGGFVADTSLLDVSVPVSSLGELLATDMLTIYAATHPMQVIKQPFWISIGYPEDITRAEEILNRLEK